MKTTVTLLVCVLAAFLLMLPNPVAALWEGEPVVHAVLFYSLTCPHCHQVITEFLVPMMEEYGDRLQMAAIDTSQPRGADLYQATVGRYNVPAERRGVPTLVIGDVVLVGSAEIPEQLPDLVEKGLAEGGIEWPDLAGMADLVAQLEQTPEPQPTIRPSATVEEVRSAQVPEASSATGAQPTETPPPRPETGVCRPDRENCAEGETSATAQPQAPAMFGPAAPAAVAAQLTEDGIVRMVFVWSQECSHCHELVENVLPLLEAKYGDQLKVASVETSENPAEYEIYLGAIDLFNVPPQRQGWPAVFIGDSHLLGSIEIREKLEGLIQHYLEQGGVAFPPITGLDTILGATREEAAETTQPNDVEAMGADLQPIHLAYFYQTGCQDCDRVKGDLEYLKTKYPQLVVESFNVREDAALCEWMGERAGVAEEHRLTAPAVFVGDGYLLEEDLDARSLEALLEAYTPGGAGRYWSDWQERSAGLAEQSIVDRFKSLGAFTVVLAGLVDGLNPCAFATMVFFVSYLTLSGRTGKEVLSVGAAFTLGVFIAYMLVGVGFYRALDMLGDVLTTLGRWLYGLTAVFCLALAVVSFSDYLRARRGQMRDMALNLPHRLRKRINTTIRKTRTSRAFVAAAFVTGVVVSFLELACTGQVYLPTIIFVMSVPGLKAQASLFLLLYNFLFVAPLVVVFVLAYYGTGAKQFSGFLQRRASTVKLGMSFLFLALGGWLAVSLI